MTQAHTKLRALAGLALCLSLVVAGCGEPVDGFDDIDSGFDSGAVERLDAASADGPLTAQVVGVVAKPAPVPTPAR